MKQNQPSKQEQPLKPNQPSKKEQPSKLRSRMVTSHQIPVMSSNKETFARQIEETVSKAPALFRQAPVILDLSPLLEELNTQTLNELVKTCRENNLVPFAATSEHKDRDKSITSSCGLAWFDLKAGNAKKQKAAEPTEATKALTTKVIKTPVRSGQQIYAQDAHLLIMNQVSAGAEVIADGNIHIMGALRGRAIAGAQGNNTAEIVCQQMQAELIAIAGNYLVQESFPVGSGSARCAMQDEQLIIDFSIEQ